MLYVIFVVFIVAITFACCVMIECTRDMKRDRAMCDRTRDMIARTNKLLNIDE